MKMWKYRVIEDGVGQFIVQIRKVKQLETFIKNKIPRLSYYLKIEWYDYCIRDTLEEAIKERDGLRKVQEGDNLKNELRNKIVNIYE